MLACVDPDWILLENQTAIGFLSNTGPDPFENVTCRCITHFYCLAVEAGFYSDLGLGGTWL